MIIKRIYQKKVYNGYTLKQRIDRVGWFLFGFIPIYIKDTHVVTYE